MTAHTCRTAAAPAVRGITAALRCCFALVVCVFALVVIVGCNQGPQRVPVSGKVVIDGVPLAKGTIRFVPKSGRPASSLIAADGSFRVAMKSLSAGGGEEIGLVPGSYRIAVLATEALGETEDAEIRWLVPRHYGNFRTSGLETDIQAPTDSLIVELTWEGAEDTNKDVEKDESSDGDKDRETLEKQKEDG